jgi:hypothetical protein
LEKACQTSVTIRRLTFSQKSRTGNSLPAQLGAIDAVRPARECPVSGAPLGSACGAKLQLAELSR